MAATYYQGHAGKVTFGASPTTLAVKGWEATHECQEHDTTSTTSVGKRQGEPGLESLTFKFDAQWAAAANPYVATPLFPPGTQITALKLYVSLSDQLFDITDGYIFKVSVKSVVDGVITWEAEGRANAWTVIGSSAS